MNGITLFPHQRADAEYLVANPNVPNFSEAGTGKTYTTLEAIRLSGYKTGVVVAPTIALHMWKTEIEKYLGATALIIKGGATKLVLPLGVYPDFYVLSYSMVINKKVWGFLHERGGDALVLDESDALSNRNSKRTIAIYGPDTDGDGGLFERFKGVYPMTGTPITRHADGLWAQLRASHAEVLHNAGVGEYWRFVHKFCATAMKKFHPRAAPKWVIVRSINRKALHDLLYNEVGALRRVLDEVQAGMPPLTYRDLVVPVTGVSELNKLLKGMSQEQIERALAAEVSGMGKAWHMLGDLKAPAASDYIIERARLEPVVAGYWHTSVGDEIESAVRAAGLVCERVKGGVSMDNRERIRVAFNAGKADVIVGQLSAMNTSWNLQECGKRVVIVEDHFSPAIVEQFIKRVWRTGQKNHVQVDFIHADHAIDGAVKAVRERKAEANAEIVK